MYFTFDLLFNGCLIEFIFRLQKAKSCLDWIWPDPQVFLCGHTGNNPIINIKLDLDYNNVKP